MVPTHLEQVDRVADANLQFICSLRQRYVPYFSINHPTRGPIFGPFAKLPSILLRRLALDVAINFSLAAGSSAEGDDELGSAVGIAVAGTPEEPYWDGAKGMMVERQASLASKSRTKR